ncbi:hypothetical protein ACFX1R_042021 [Malus domestica]
MVRHVGWQGPEVGSAWAKEASWQGPLLGLFGLARANSNLCSWGRGLWRWGAVLGEPHGSCPLGSWTLLRLGWRLKEMRRSWASWVAGMLGMQASCLLECWVELLC